MYSLRDTFGSVPNITATYVFDAIRDGKVQDFTKPLVNGVMEAMVRLYKAGK